MKVLLMARHDWANMGYVLSQCLREVGVDATMLLKNVGRSRYPKHGIPLKGKAVKKYAKEADIIQFMHSQWFNVDLKSKRVFVFHGGGSYREYHGKLNKTFNKVVEKSIIQTGDLFGLGAKNEVWLLPAVDTNMLKPVYKRKSNKIIIGHFPSGAKVKNSEGIRKVIEKVRKDFGHKFDYVFSFHPAMWVNQIKRVSECDIYIEACAPTLKGKTKIVRKYGEWGVAAIEAAALGKVVISHFLSHKRYEKEYGQCGIKVANSLDEMEVQLRKLLSLSDSELLQIRKDTRAWVEKYHSYKAVGERLKKVVYGI